MIKAVRAGDKIADGVKAGKAGGTTVQAGKDLDKASDGAKGVKAQNLKEAADKGIPSSQLGPSGKPKTHTVCKPNAKRSKDAARNNPKSNTKPKKTPAIKVKRHTTIPQEMEKK